MIACFLKKVHDQNQRKIGKNMVFWSCTKCDMCYKVIKERNNSNRVSEKTPLLCRKNKLNKRESRYAR